MRFTVFLLTLFSVCWLSTACAWSAGTGGGLKSLLARSYSITKNDVGLYPSFLSENRLYALGFGAVLAGSFALDGGLRAYALGHRSGAANTVSNIAYPFGKFYYVLPAVSLLSLYGYYSKNGKLTDASLTALESVLVAGAGALFVKVVAGRERPGYTADPVEFRPFNVEDRFNSLPSGDATIAWAAVTPYAIYYRQPLLFLIPAAVNFERVYKNKHWASDTLLGAALGFSVGYLFSENHIRLFGKKVSVSPEGEGIALNVGF